MNAALSSADGEVEPEDSSNKTKQPKKDLKLGADAATNKEKFRKNSKLTRVKDFLMEIGSIFIPLIPAFVGAGLLGGVYNILSNMVTAGIIDGNNASVSSIIDIFSLSYAALFSFLVIYIGISAAKKFDLQPYIGGIIGGITMLPTATETNPVLSLFTQQPLQSGEGGVVGVLIAVWIASLIEKGLKKKVPEDY